MYLQKINNTVLDLMEINKSHLFSLKARDGTMCTLTFHFNCIDLSQVSHQIVTSIKSDDCLHLLSS